MKYVIYKILCKSSNKFYIGSATWYSKRKDKHLWGLRNGKHCNPYLQNAWNKYTESDFEFIVIEQCTAENLLEKEQYWLDNTKCYDRNIGYNISKLASSKKGTKMPDSAKKKIGDFWRGKKHSEERRQKMKLRATLNQGKSVIQYDRDMKVIKEFLSISEASRETGFSISAISKQCSTSIRNKIRSKYIFKYKDIV